MIKAPFEVPGGGFHPYYVVACSVVQNSLKWSDLKWEGGVWLGEPYFTTVAAGGNKCVDDVWVNVAEDGVMASWIWLLISFFW